MPAALKMALQINRIKKASQIERKLNSKMKPRIRSTLALVLFSAALILLTFAATCRLVMTNIQIDYDPSSPATITLTVFGQSDEYALAIDPAAE